ncbi:MAG: TetR/AcrR family transcriptional regulator [Anaerolineales bacterium]|nr:TetR/AcrR family transcriptional regulator [Anaerolineales bacterium]MCB8983649.1 TetR/AcrR family transcriptional regulator [Ardenticatenaceae bacterium]
MTEDQESRQKILDAAFAEFADKGFRGATIKSIAQRAELQSPSLIYWYFATKEALFQAAIQSHSPFAEVVLDPAPLLDTPPDVVLTQLAQSYLYYMSQPNIQNLMRLLLSELGKRPQLAELVSQGLMEPVLDFLQTYLTHQIEMGRLRPHDVRFSARALIGLMAPQVFGLLFFPGLRLDGVPNDTYVQTMFDIFLTGLRPSAEG